uniref:3-beta hydroxysteroid dehydrogenase/isomerase domain-containing protein n=1 Tax=Knipowitschia caucasica TaxID=637954 RepID=A0AAV2KES2_KNICA
MSRDQRGLVYLVSGGCGFLGKHLLRVLLEQERGKVSEIRLFDKMIDSSLEEHSTESMKVVVIQGDITDYSQVQEASREVDVFIHSASLVDVWHKVPESVIYGVNRKNALNQRKSTPSAQSAAEPQTGSQWLQFTDA